MKHIFIIRHGETDNNKHHLLQGRGINASINEKGKEQAECVSEALKDIPIKKIVVSSLRRTIETATPLIEQTKAVVESYSELDEMGFGHWEGAYFEDVKEGIEAINQRWKQGEVELEIPGGESPQQVFDRASEKLIEVVKNSKEEYIAFVIHGRLIRILLSGILGYTLKNMHLIKHQNGAINHLIWDGEQFEVIELNKIDHLKTIQVLSD